MCCASRNEEVTAPALALLGATVQPETQPAETDATHTVVLEGEGLWIAEEVAAHAQNVDVELGLS